MLEDILRNATRQAELLRSDPQGKDLYAQQEQRLRQEPKYRAALQDNALGAEEFNYLVLFEVTRVEIYRPDTPGIVERIWDEFSRRVGATPDLAEDIWGMIEQTVNDHYNTMQWVFGPYAKDFGESKQ